LPAKKLPVSENKKRFFANSEDKKMLSRALTETDIEWVDSVNDADVVFECPTQSTCDVFGPGGVVRVARLKDGVTGVVAERIAEVAITARSVADLLSIDALDSSMRLHMNAVGQPSTGLQPYGARGIKLTASVSNHQIRFYSPGDERTYLNSLQLSVTSDTECYLTLISVDSAGAVMQLIPNVLQEQSGFLKDGLIRPNQTVLIPDALDETNRAGFYMDYAPPAGTETIRAFCTADVNTASRLRDAVSRIANGDPFVYLSETLIVSRGLTGLSPQQEAASTNWGASTITVEISGN
jgi:hypothetical protein